MKTIRNTITRFALAGMFAVSMMSIKAAQAQSGCTFSASVQQEVCGNGFGSQFSLASRIGFRNHSIEPGFILGSGSGSFSGWSVRYQYLLLDPAKEYTRTAIYSWVKFSSRFDHKLSRKSLSMENMVTRGAYENLSEVTYDANDVHAGFGMRFQLSKKLRLETCIGAGAYWTTSTSEELPAYTYRDKSDFSLLLGTGLSYEF